MFGADYVWIVLEEFGVPPWPDHARCNQSVLEIVIEGLIIHAQDYNVTSKNSTSVSGLVSI